RAAQLVESGRPAELLEVTVPLPMIISAGGFVDKYGPEEKYDYLTFIAGVRCPMLVMLGGKEVDTNFAFRQAPSRLRGGAERVGNPTVQVVAGADRFYTGVRPDAWACLESWLRRFS